MKVINILITLGVVYSISVIVYLIDPLWPIVSFTWLTCPQYNYLGSCGNTNIEYWLSRSMALQLISIIIYGLYKIIDRYKK